MRRQHLTEGDEEGNAGDVGEEGHGECGENPENPPTRGEPRREDADEQKKYAEKMKACAIRAPGHLERAHDESSAGRRELGRRWNTQQREDEGGRAK